MMRKVMMDRVFLLLIYMDDILMIATEEEIQFMKARVFKEFQSIMIELVDIILGHASKKRGRE
jgi:hypothetical protein